MSETRHFIYQFSPGERADLATNPDAWTEEDNRIGVAHFQRLKQAMDDGVLIFAGRSMDGIGPAVVVFEAGTEKEAQNFMLDDPFVRHGLFKAQLHPFRAALVRVP